MKKDAAEKKIRLKLKSTIKQNRFILFFCPFFIVLLILNGLQHFIATLRVILFFLFTTLDQTHKPAYSSA